jgi:RNA polymerase sigma-70 factor (ECF subfamily)
MEPFWGVLRLRVVTVADIPAHALARSADAELDPVLDFTEFSTAHADHLARALALALNNRELGRDAAHEALARAWERWSTVSTHDNPAGWVYRVGLNWGRSRLRRRRREVLTVLVPERPTPPPQFDDSIATALAKLSADHRAIVVGRYYLDWSEADLAAAFDLAPGTVKSRLSRALANLQQHLEQP